MRLEVFPDAAATQAAAAQFLGDSARSAVDRRGRCVVACSGGRDPWEMFRLLASAPLPWSRLHFMQVDERAVPIADDARNWKHLKAHLVDRVPLPPENAHPMPVEHGDPEQAALQYAATLRRIAGPAAVIDIVHLGLGEDGHTASLVPQDPVLAVEDHDVAVTQPYQGHRRMTLTYPALNRARCLLWLITGRSKAGALARMLKGDPSIPAGRVNQEHAVVFADRAAAGRG